MAGIYIHIPFCRKACHYCNFHFSTNLKSVENVIQAMLLEVELRKTYLNEPVNTIYFGGGTPSAIHPSHLNSILQVLGKSFSLEVSEMTLEANPEDITLENLAMWKELGINRLSLGIQSFQDQHLVWMNRSHDRKQALLAISLIQEASFSNYTVDLIFGFDKLSLNELQENLSIITDLGVPHVSAYGMTIEPKTVLGYQTHQGTYSPLADEDFNTQMRLIINTLNAKGYEHYEISNYALPGRQALHNTNYWKGMKYLGIGPGAHSYNGTHRQWNISNNQKYVKMIQAGESFFYGEELSTRDRYNEYIMTRMRMSEGVDLNELQQRFPEHYLVFQREIETYSGRFMQVHNHQARLTLEGKFIADQIISALFHIQ